MRGSKKKQRQIALHGGCEGLPAKGQPEPTEKPRILPWMRQVRETTKTLKILTELIKQFEAEKTALMVTVAETAGEYAL